MALRVRWRARRWIEHTPIAWTFQNVRNEFLNMLVKRKILKPRLSSSGRPKIFLLGLTHSGKTTILNLFTGSGPQLVLPTQGFTISPVRRENYLMNFWDIGGEFMKQPPWHRYLDDTTAVIFVIDSTDRSRFLEVNDALATIFECRCMQKTPVLILCNKNDLPGAATTDDIIDGCLLDSIMDRHLCIQQCSAITGSGIMEGMDWVWGIVKESCHPDEDYKKYVVSSEPSL